MQSLAKYSVLSLVIASLIGFAFIALRNDYVPTADQIQARESFQPFLIEPSELTGIYANADVDSAVFKYSTDIQEGPFWRRVDQQAKENDWVPVESDGEVRRFQRVIPPDGEKTLWRVDELRIRYVRAKRIVVVGWVQADPSRAVKGLADCSESSFAEKVIWPRVRNE